MHDESTRDRRKTAVTAGPAAVRMTELDARGQEGTDRASVRD
jgi:hypothetical protein